MRTSIIAVFVAVCGGSVPAAAQPKVAVGEVTGPTGAQVGYAVERALADKAEVISNQTWEQTATSMSLAPEAESSLAPVAGELGADAVVIGDVTRAGREWKGRLRVFEVGTGRFTKEWTFETASLRNLSAIAGRQAWPQLGAALRASASARSAAPAAPAPAPAAPKSIVVLPFVGGDRASRVRKVVVQKLDSAPAVERRDEQEVIGRAREVGVVLKDPVGRVAVSELDGIDVFVFGEVFKRGGTYYAAVEVDQGLDGELVETIKLKRKGIVALGSAVAARILAAAQKAEGQSVAPPPPPPAVGIGAAAGAAAAPTSPSTDEPSAIEGPPATKERPARNRSTSALEVSLGFTSFFRKFDYNQPLTALRPYEANLVAALTLGGRWYPVAHFSDHWSRHIGLEFDVDYAVGLSSKDSVTDAEFPTNSFAIRGGLRGRIPLGESELGLNVTFGTDRFSLDPTEQGVPPDIPSAEYEFVRAGADGRWRVVDFLDLGFAGGYRIVTGAGEILDEDGDWFPKGDVGGFDVTAKIGTPILDPVHFEAGVNYIHYFFSFNVDANDAAAGAPIAGGALDQYTEIFVRAVLVL